MNNNDQFLFIDRVVIGNFSAVEMSAVEQSKQNETSSSSLHR